MAEKGKELRRMNRTELIEIIYVLQQNEKILRAENEELRNKLNERILLMSEAGSIAEAALGINRIFDAAQAAADQYLESVEVNFSGTKEIIPDITEEAATAAKEENKQPEDIPAAEEAVPEEAAEAVPEEEEKTEATAEETILTEEEEEASNLIFEEDSETAKFKSEMDMEFERILNSIRTAADEYLQLTKEIDTEAENKTFSEEKTGFSPAEKIITEEETEENTPPRSFEEDFSDKTAPSPAGFIGDLQNRFNKYLKFGKDALMRRIDGFGEDQNTK